MSDVVIAQHYFKMSEANTSSDDEESSFQANDSRSNSSTEDYLDLVDLNDFQECESTLQQWESDKQKNIERLIEYGKPSDASRFRELCFRRGGLLNDSLRKRSWPVILDNTLIWDDVSAEEIKHHHYYSQVVLDVKRILKRFPPGIDEVIQADLQVKVTHLIIRVLIRNEGLHYYQGFHDVAITMLLVLDDERSYSILCQLVQSHFHLFMGPDMQPTMEILNLVYCLVKRKNPQLYDYLVKAELGTIFCLPWAITWFGHVLNSYDLVVRLFDVFISSHPWTSMYLAAVIVLHRADEIFSTSCEMPLLHQMLSNVPEDLPFDALLEETESLMLTYPPDLMEGAVREMHNENMLRIKKEEEEMKKRIELRRAAIAKNKQQLEKRTAVVVVSHWIRRPFRSQTVQMVALIISGATAAFIYKYTQSGLEVF